MPIGWVTPASFDNGQPPEQECCGCQIVYDDFHRNDSDPESDRAHSQQGNTVAELHRAVGFDWAVPAQEANNWQISSNTLICSLAGAKLVCLRHSRWWAIAINVNCTLPNNSTLRIYPNCDGTVGSTYVEWAKTATTSTLTVVGSETKSYPCSGDNFGACVSMLASSTEAYTLTGNIGATILTVPISTPDKSSFIIELVTGSCAISSVSADNIGPVQVAPADDSNGAWDHTTGTINCGTTCSMDCGCPSSSTTGTMTVTLSGLSDHGDNDFGYDVCMSGPTVISGSGDDTGCYGCIQAPGGTGWPACEGVLAPCSWWTNETPLIPCTPTTCADANTTYTLHWQGFCSWSGAGTNPICCGPPSVELVPIFSVVMTYNTTTNQTTITATAAIGGGATYTHVATGRISCDELEGLSLEPTGDPIAGFCNWAGTTIEIGSVT